MNLDIELNRRIAQIVRALYYSVTNAWAEIAMKHKMSSAQQYLLYVLTSRKQGLSIVEISRIGCWHPSTVTRLLKPLVNAEYVSVTNGRGKSKIVQLTELGALKLKQINEYIHHRYNFPLNCTGIDDESLETFERVGLQLLRNQKGTEFTQWLRGTETSSAGVSVDEWS